MGGHLVIFKKCILQFVGGLSGIFYAWHLHPLLPFLCSKEATGQRHDFCSQRVNKCADELEELLRREKEAGVTPDPELNAFMRAEVRTGKRESIVTDLVIKMLGLDVSRLHAHAALQLSVCFACQVQLSRYSCAALDLVAHTPSDHQEKLHCVTCCLCNFCWRNSVQVSVVTVMSCVLGCDDHCSAILLVMRPKTCDLLGLQTF